MTSTVAHEIHLASRPRGWPSLADFRLVERPLPELREGEVLVRNLFISVDPYMRARMNDVKTYVDPFPLDQPLDGGAVGEVEASTAPRLAPGTIVLSSRGWRDRFIAPAGEVRAIEAPIARRSAYLGALGMTGFTAWVGLNLVDVKAGDRVFVSAAAGATGSVAGQLAKLRGCFVVGSAGSREKVELLTRTLGFDAAFNYKDGDIGARLAAAAPEGIDVYFDNVGGEHLEAALDAMRTHGRIIACGAIARYNDTAPAPGPRNLAAVIWRRLTIRGFIVSDSFDQMPRFLAEVTPLVERGQLKLEETIIDGLERAPQAFIDMLRGQNVGKMLVRVS